MKRFLALVLAMSLTLSLVPVTTLAEETAPEETVSYDVPTEAPETEAPTTEPPTTETTTATEETTEATTEPTEPTLDLFAEDEDVISSGTCGAQGDNLTWKLTEDGTLTISGTGEMQYYNSDSSVAPWYSNRTGILSVVVEPGVTSIGHCAFYACLKLASVTLPESLKSIGYYAFMNCTKLSEIDIPESVTSIGYQTFYGCSRLTSITIPKSVSSIDGCAFYGCASLTGILIPEGVTCINNDTFSGCTGLKSVVIPGSVTGIGSSAFKGCRSLTSITIPESVSSIDSGAFQNCVGLISITIPEGVTRVSVQAFSGCTGLTDVTIPGSVTGIESSAFEGCTSLTGVIIPEGVIQIGDSAFQDCSSLRSAKIPEGVTKIGGRAFMNCTGLQDVTIPESVTSIDYQAFEGCSSLVSIAIPDGVTRISNYAFSGCGLTSIMLPSDVAGIDIGAFAGCHSLTSITIPESVVSIGTGAFFGCEKLAHVYYGGSDLQWKDIKIGDNNERLTNAAIHYGITHTHNPERISGKAATCTEAGNREYWHCFDCDEYFADADCTQVIREADMVLPALGHDMTKVEAVVPTYTATGNNEYYTCSRCGRAFKDEQGETETTVEAETLAKLDKGTEIRPIDTTALISGSKLTLTAWTLPGGKKAKVKWSLSEDSKAYASISSSGVLRAKTVSEVQNITVIATPTDGSPEARKEIQILPKITAKQTEKLNLFYGNGRAKLAITGGQVTSAQFVEPSDFVLDDNDGQFYIRLAEGASAKPKTKVTLEITLSGCDTPIKQSLTIATMTAAPKLKLNPTASIVNTTLTSSLTVETAILGTEDTLTVRSATKGVTASVDNGILTLTLDTPKTTTATIYLKGSDWAKEIKLTHRITVTDKKPTVKFAAKGKLDVLNPASKIIYTPKLSNAAGTITDVRLDGQDANLFNAEVVDGLVHLKLAKSGENYATKKTYKVTPVVILLGEEITGSALSVKVTQSAMKLAKLPNRTVYQSQTAPLAVKLTVTSPANAKIGDVQLNAKTTAALWNALENAGGINFEADTVTFPASAFADLKPGKYTVILDVFPANAASDTKPIRAKFTLTVQK